MFFSAGSPASSTRFSSISIPVIGDLHLVTSLFFDVGVYLVVVGLVLDILRSLGAEIDRQAEADGEHDAVGGDAEPGEQVRVDSAAVGLLADPPGPGGAR